MVCSCCVHAVYDEYTVDLIVRVCDRDYLCDKYVLLLSLCVSVIVMSVCVLKYCTCVCSCYVYCL